MDPPRPDAIVAIELARRAGITVKMITGDHPVTALAIGKMLGLNVHRHHQSHTGEIDVESGGSNNDNGDGRAVTGGELDEYLLRSMAEFDQCVSEYDIFARTTPEHKLRIVQSLQRQGFVCSMTGDGVNDAPALKAANIGVAMGITGLHICNFVSRFVFISF
jgi:magnesium-transporting ATPase (P-type)